MPPRHEKVHRGFLDIQIQGPELLDSVDHQVDVPFPAQIAKCLQVDSIPRAPLDRGHADDPRSIVHGRLEGLDGENAVLSSRYRDEFDSDRGFFHLPRDRDL